MLGQSLTLAQCTDLHCDRVQYAVGGPPWEAWETMPADPPEGYVVLGPWQCLAGERRWDESQVWLWARPLDVDEDAVRRKAEEAEKRSRAAADKAGLIRLRDDLEALGYGEGTKVWADLAVAAAAGYRNLAAIGLVRVRMQDLRSLGRNFGIRSATHERLRAALLDRYLNVEEVER